MGGLILGVNTLYMLFCFFKLFLTVDKGLILSLCYAGWIWVATVLTYRYFTCYGNTCSRYRCTETSDFWK